MHQCFTMLVTNVDILFLSPGVYARKTRYFISRYSTLSQTYISSPLTSCAHIYVIQMRDLTWHQNPGFTASIETADGIWWPSSPEKKGLNAISRYWFRWVRSWREIRDAHALVCQISTGNDDDGQERSLIATWIKQKRYKIFIINFLFLQVIDK